MDDRSHLDALPDGFATTVASLHRVAERIVAPARKPDNEIALEATPGGFGTPFFEHSGVRHQVRVEGVELVHTEGEGERRAPLESLAAAAAVVADLLPDAELGDTPLTVDSASAQVLGEWYGFGAAILTRLLAAATPADAATPVRLWPEHFDIAIELGPEQEGARANYGASPGDADHPEPYLYVGPWTAEVEGPLWRARGFKGAELAYSELLAAGDPKATALDFFLTRKNALGVARDHQSEETK
jgi:hypothetical protein